MHLRVRGASILRRSARFRVVETFDPVIRRGSRIRIEMGVEQGFQPLWLNRAAFLLSMFVVDV